MSEQLRVGQRVHVEFDGLVIAADASAVDVQVRGYTAPVRRVFVELATVIPDPVKVGDKVTAENVAQLPHGTIVATPGNLDARTLFIGEETGERRWFYGGRWQPGDFDNEVAGTVVLRVGGGEAS